MKGKLMKKQSLVSFDLTIFINIQVKLICEQINMWENNSI